MPIRVEAGWIINPESGQICGVRGDQTAIRYQLGSRTKISRATLRNWWGGKPLAITYPDVILRPNPENPPVVEATKIRVAPKGMKPGQIPETPEYLKRLR